MGWGSGNLGGGSGGLNFKVVAYKTEGELLSSTPNENTIGVITTTPITALIFSPVKPQSLLDGGVWISTGTSSAVAFNAIKAKNKAILLYPISAMQYVDGTWSDVVAKSYQGDAWVAWWNGQLYENGNTYASVTGGYSVYGDGTTLTENADHLLIKSQGNSGVYTNNPVDMTDYNTLTFDWTCVRGGIDIQFQVRSDKSTGTSGWAAGTKIVGPDTKRQTTTLDISGLSGSYYVGIGRFTSGGPNEVKIHSIIMS